MTVQRLAASECGPFFLRKGKKLAPMLSEAPGSSDRPAVHSNEIDFRHVCNLQVDFRDIAGLIYEQWLEQADVISI